MSFDFKKILESKSALRRRLAARPIAEKLALLDELRERELSLRKAAAALHRTVVSETSATYNPEPKGKKSTKG